jgi:hypothetical protein
VLQLDNFVWSDGSTEPPVDAFVVDRDCPFDDDDVKQSDFGVMIGVLICMLLMAVMGGITVVVWKRFWNFNLVPLNHRAPFSQSDFQHIATMAIEFIQTMAMGPSIKSLNYVLWTIGMMCQVDLSNVVDMKEGTFLIVIDVVLAITPVYFFLFSALALNLKNRFPDSYLAAVLDSAAMILLPVIGNVLFMPIIAILLSVFVCYETSGDDISDAFLEKDCYETCWQGEHAIYLSFAAVVLVIYEPLSVYMRPKW